MGDFSAWLHAVESLLSLLACVRCSKWVILVLGCTQLLQEATVFHSFHCYTSGLLSGTLLRTVFIKMGDFSAWLHAVESLLSLVAYGVKNG